MDLSDFTGQQIVVTTTPDYWCVEYEIDCINRRWDSASAMFVTSIERKRNAYMMIFKSAEDATAFAQSETAASVWKDLDSITWIGNYVVPLARIPF